MGRVRTKQDERGKPLTLQDNGSQWYLIEMGWLNDWKQYVGYGGVRPSEVHPGMISNEKLLDVKERIVPV